MKHYLLAVALICFGSPAFAQDAVPPIVPTAPESAPRRHYLESIFTDPAHPQVSAGVTFNSKFEFNGGGTMLAIVYHRADPEQTLVPRVLQNIGVKPMSWALQAGIGGSKGNFVVPFGASVNLTPTILGPALSAMNASGNATAKGIASIIDSPNGGVSFGPNWTARGMVDGVILPVNQWTFPPGWFVGGLWKF